MKVLLLAMLLTAPPSSSTDASSQGIKVVFAESIAGVRPGMTRVEVEKAGHKLASEGINRMHASGAKRTGFYSGPAILFLFDEQEHVVLISVELKKSSGLEVGRVRVPSTASLDDLAKLFLGCTLEKGSGGRALACKDEKGRVLNAYDSYGGPEVWVHLGPG